MVILLLNSHEQKNVIRRHKESDCDRFDEVWDNIYAVSPNPDLEHQGVGTALATILTIAIEWAGLGHVFQAVNVSDREDDWEHNYCIPCVAVDLQGNPARACGRTGSAGMTSPSRSSPQRSLPRETPLLREHPDTRAVDRRSRHLGARALPAPRRRPRPDRHVGPRATDPPGQCGLADELPPRPGGETPPDQGGPCQRRPALARLACQRGPDTLSRPSDRGSTVA